MERVFIKCRQIAYLEKMMQDGTKDALDYFWNDIKSTGTPLIQKYSDEDGYDLVTIIYKGSQKTKNVVLIPPVGMRKLENCIMDNVPDTDVWYIAYKVKDDISFTYQFSENDPLDKDWNRRWRNVKNDQFNKKCILHYDKSVHRDRMVPYVNLPNARKKKYIYNNKLSHHGSLQKDTLYSSVLKEYRKITIYLPYDYDSKSSYNVLVLNDGREYLNILNANYILDNLIDNHKIEPIIAVFVESTDDRKKNLSCDDAFSEFIGVELFNYLRRNYNISDNTEGNVIGGYSLGGLASSYIAMKYSDVFQNVLSQSGSYWFGYEYNKKGSEMWIIQKYKSQGKLPLKFYINVGKIEPKVSMIDTNISFKDYLLQENYDVKFDMFGSGHDYLYWDETLADGLIYLLGKN